MTRILFFFFLTLPVLTVGQAADDRTAVIETIKVIFDGMRAGDSAAMRAVLHPAARLLTTGVDREGKPVMNEVAVGRWLEAVAQPKNEIYDERIWSYDVQVDQNLATVWTEYTFYRGDQLSHCGVNAFHLFRDSDGWKIIQITDTRRREACITPENNVENELDDLIDNWHIAAAMADANAFFGNMTPDAVYIGTDAGERWRRDELREWAKDAFKRDSAWDFKPSDRHIAVGADGRSAWWDEKLDTWMGVCRGSGVLVRTPDGWKIQHYQLSVTVPNEKIPKFIELVKE